jgi:NitT/TauT family transport system permease protein
VNENQKSGAGLSSAIAFAIFLLIWELAARAGWISSTFFPPPTKIWVALVKLIGNGAMASAIAATLFRFSMGLISGSSLGALLGLLMGRSPRMNAFLNPFIAAIYPIPKIAIFPILMVIFGIGEGSKFAAIFLAAFFPMLITSLAGVRQINKVYFEVGQNYGARGRQVLTHILLPGSLPSLIAGLRLATNMAFVITITVEIITAKTGLGVLMWFGWQTLRASELYAVLVVVSLLGVGFNALLDGLTKVFVPWLGE